MALLIGSDFRNALDDLISGASNRLVVFSAFIKCDALLWLEEIVCEDIEVFIVARWQKRDLLFGASDLNVYTKCQEFGWKFGVDLNLHGKLYLADSERVLMGSANLTNRGLNLTGYGNLEFGALLDLHQIDMDRLARILDDVKWIDDHVFHQLEKELLQTSQPQITESSSNWSSSVLSVLETPVSQLWVHELVFSSPKDLLVPNLSDEYTLHDYSLLELDFNSISYEQLICSFKRTRQYSWAIFQLKINDSISFGAFSNLLHNSLLDDPRPYRASVKEFIRILFDWFRFMTDDFIVTEHSHSSSVRLNNF